MKDNYDLPEDEFANDDIITLMSANGEEIDFVEIAGIAHKDNFYAMLQPVDRPDFMSEDEALVFLVTKDDEGNDKFDIVLDDDIIDAVFATYNELLDKAQADEAE